MKTAFTLMFAIALAALAKAGDQEQNPTNSIRIAVVQQNGNAGKPDENRMGKTSLKSKLRDRTEGPQEFHL
jgi:hypothetical protein